MKIVINNPKTGKSYQKEIPEDVETVLYGKKIGDIIDGSLLQLSGYKLKITGGTDKDGFPMRPDLPGTERRQILAGRSVGIRKVPEKGYRRRKTVRGNTVAEDIAQLNLKIVKHGDVDIENLMGKKENEAEEGSSS